MGLEAVKEEVIRAAKEQEAAMIAEARKEASRLLKEAEKKIDEIKQRSEEETKKMIDVIKKQAIASAELEVKKMLLETKKQLIENVFAETEKRLESLDDKKRESLIKKLFDRAKKEIEVESVYCSKKDLKFIKGANAEPIGIIGGLIAENKDKTIRVNYSFESMLESIKNTELQNINKLLFA